MLNMDSFFRLAWVLNRYFFQLDKVSHACVYEADTSNPIERKWHGVFWNAINKALFKVFKKWPTGIIGFISHAFWSPMFFNPIIKAGINHPCRWNDADNFPCSGTHWKWICAIGNDGMDGVFNILCVFHDEMNLVDNNEESCWVLCSTWHGFFLSKTGRKKPDFRKKCK